MSTVALPAAERGYLAEVLAVMENLVGDRLLGLYLFGSGAYGGYRPGRSDLDVQGIVADALAIGEKERLAGRLDHRALRCPAKGMEFVVYRADVAARPPAPPPFEINLNTGRGVGERRSFDIAEEPATHWFTLDLAIGRETGVPLFGPDPSDLIGPTPRPAVLDALARSLAWHRAEERTLDNTVLNACRAWRFVEEDRWGSKDDAAAWGAARDSSGVVAAAAAARHSTSVVDRRAAIAFLDRVAGAVSAAREPFGPTG